MSLFHLFNQNEFVKLDRVRCDNLHCDVTDMLLIRINLVETFSSRVTVMTTTKLGADYSNGYDGTCFNAGVRKFQGVAIYQSGRFILEITKCFRADPLISSDL